MPSATAQKGPARPALGGLWAGRAVWSPTTPYHLAEEHDRGGSVITPAVMSLHQDGLGWQVRSRGLDRDEI